MTDETDTNDASDTATDPLVLNADDVVTRLASLGLSAETISAVVPIPQRDIRTILSVRRRVKSPEEQALTEDVRRLAQLAIRKAHTIIEFGPPDQRFALIRTIIANASKLISAEEDTTTEELRTEFEGLLADMRGVAPADAIIDESFTIDSTAEEVDAPHVATPTLVAAVDHQDDEHGVPQTGFELR